MVLVAVNSKYPIKETMSHSKGFTKDFTMFKVCTNLVYDLQFLTGFFLMF